MSALHTAALAALDVARAEIAAGTTGEWVHRLDTATRGYITAVDVGIVIDDLDSLDAALIVASVNARAAALDLTGMVFEGHAPKMVGTQGPFCHRCNSPTITMSPSHPCALYTAALRVVGVQAEDFQ